jgi:hypothetical protein
MDADAAKSNPDRYVILPAALLAAQRSGEMPVGVTEPTRPDGAAAA